MGMLTKCFLIFPRVLFQSEYVVDNVVVQATEHAIFPEICLLITYLVFFFGYRIKICDGFCRR